MNSKILNNVKFIMDKYGERIKNDKQLVLMYWLVIDQVRVDKDTISTKDFLTKATSESEILNTKLMLNVMKESNK